MLNLLFGFSGRIGRGQFWVGFALALGSGALSVVGRLDGLSALAVAGLVGYLWLGAAAFVKRLHDLNSSGWWAVFALVPLAGPVVMALICGTVPGRRSA